MQNIVIVGDTCAGKTSFARYLTGHEFTESYMVTIGKDMHILETLVVHDIGGQKRFSKSCEAYYKHAHGALIFYESGLSSSVSKWIKLLRKENKDIPIVIVCNKIDLKENKDEWKEPCVSISCKTGENVDKVMDMLTPKLIKISPPETWYEHYLPFGYCSVQ